MKLGSISVVEARPEDAEAWIRLESAAQGTPLPADMRAQIDRFRAALPEDAANRLIGWAGGVAVACCRLHRAGRVVDLRAFYVEPGYLDAVGACFLEGVVALARARGSVLTVEYPRSYSGIFTGAGFREGTRTRMKVDLATYERRRVMLPQGITLRHPEDVDEAPVADLAFRNYAGTVDGDMVSSSREQAEAMIRAMFRSEYSVFGPDCSYLAQDLSGNLVGDILTGEVTSQGGERTIWVLDISLAAEWRGRGLGKALLSSVLNRAKDVGFAHAGLIVTLGNEQAHALYLSFGFRDYGDLMYEAVLKIGPTA